MVGKNNNFLLQNWEAPFNRTQRSISSYYYCYYFVILLLQSKFGILYALR